MTVRRLAVLVRGLPASARVWTAKNGGWTVTDHLLATQIELLVGIKDTVWATVSTPPKQKPKIRPYRFPRPGAEKPKPVGFGGLARALLGGD
jgi:hypothetical protein